MYDTEYQKRRDLEAEAWEAIAYGISPEQFYPGGQIPEGFMEIYTQILESHFPKDKSETPKIYVLDEPETKHPVGFRSARSGSEIELQRHPHVYVDEDELWEEYGNVGSHRQGGRGGNRGISRSYSEWYDNVHGGYSSYSYASQGKVLKFKSSRLSEVVAELEAQVGEIRLVEEVQPTESFREASGNNRRRRHGKDRKKGREKSVSKSGNLLVVEDLGELSSIPVKRIWDWFTAKQKQTIGALCKEYGNKRVKAFATPKAIGEIVTVETPHAVYQVKPNGKCFEIKES